jgi:hypothetical protein
MKTSLSLAIVLGLVSATTLSAQDQHRTPQTALRAAILHEGILLAQNSTKSPSAPVPQRSWRTRHPVAFGAIVGSISGSAVGWLWLAANCHNGESVCSPAGAAMWTGMFAGIGAGGGAAVGALSAR